MLAISLNFTPHVLSLTCYAYSYSLKQCLYQKCDTSKPNADNLYSCKQLLTNNKIKVHFPTQLFITVVNDFGQLYNIHINVV